MKAFSLVNAHHLPVTGESHPLIRESTRWLTTGNACTLLGAMLLFAILYAWSEMTPDEPPVVNFPTVITVDNWTPRQIAAETDPSGGSKPPAPDDKLAVPDPVTDSEAPEDEFLAPDDWNPGGIDGIGDGPIDVMSPPYDSSPDTVVVFDELPVLLSIGEPNYPDLAQRAGIDGTVLVKVLISRTGKVKNAVAIEGPELLRNAAVDAAKTALFTPAKQGDMPVEVWVMLPVTFALNR
jgi:TonB family protein